MTYKIEADFAASKDANGESAQWGKDIAGNRVERLLAADGAQIGPRGSVTDHSSQTVIGDKTLIAANTARQYLFLQNISDTDMYVKYADVAASAAAGSFLLAKNGGMLWMTTPNFVYTGAIHIYSTAIKDYTCVEA